jgi:hypothetical protein
MTQVIPPKPPLPGNRLSLTQLKKLTPEMIARLRERRRRIAAITPVAEPESPVSLTMPAVDYAIPTRRAAEMLGVSVETMKKWRQRGNGPAFSKYPDGAVRYRISDVVKFFENAQMNGTK